MAAQKNYAVWVYGLVLELFLTTIEVSFLVFTCCKQTETVSLPGSCTRNGNSGLWSSSELSRRLHSLEVGVNTCSTGTGFSVRPSVFHGQYNFNSAFYSRSSLDLKVMADKAGDLRTLVVLFRGEGTSRKKSMKREDQQDATIRFLLLTSVSTCFGHHYAHLQENKNRVTAFGVLLWFCWMWLVAVVGRCVVGCEHY